MANQTVSCVHCGLGLVWSPGLRAFAAPTFTQALCGAGPRSEHAVGLVLAAALEAARTGADLTPGALHRLIASGAVVWLDDDGTWGWSA